MPRAKLSFSLAALRQPSSVMRDAKNRPLRHQEFQ